MAGDLSFLLLFYGILIQFTKFIQPITYTQVKSVLAAFTDSFMLLCFNELFFLVFDNFDGIYFSFIVTFFLNPVGVIFL